MSLESNKIPRSLIASSLASTMLEILYSKRASNTYQKNRWRHLAIKENIHNCREYVQHSRTIHTADILDKTIKYETTMKIINSYVKFINT